MRPADRRNPTRRRPRALAIAVLAAGGLLASCTQSTSTTPEPEPVAATFPERGPQFEVLSTPDGFTQARFNEVPEQWVPLLTHSGGCVLAGRGVVGESDSEIDDNRAASVQRLDEVISELALEDATAPQDINIAVAGAAGAASGLADQEGAVPFVSSDGSATEGTSTEGTVRVGVRVGSSQNADGDWSEESLELRFACPGPIQEAVWDEVTVPLRADFISLGPEAETGW